MEYLAHSKREEISPQTYSSHVNGVYDRAVKFAEEAEAYASSVDGQLKNIAARAAIFHDLGKLLPENQAALRSETVRAALPINHVDAGAAELKKENFPYSAAMVYSHHRGLPDFTDEYVKQEQFLRDEHKGTCINVDNMLDELLDIHCGLIDNRGLPEEECVTASLPVFMRMALSCIADADHSDTAENYGNYPKDDEMPRLRAEERLSLLDEKVALLGSDDERSTLRTEMYYACRDSAQMGDFSICDSPVGSGKTTAVMAHLLNQAIKRGARRIFVVLPFTSIITQSVQTYRDYLVLPGEDPEKVVAELHYRADFSEYDTRYLTSLWRAPIIVTTAVSFFETLASNRPAALRRLHELPGSVIFVDESHAALPVKLLPTAWLWMNVLADEWGCYWVFASGSLVRFWALPEIMEIYSDNEYIKAKSDAAMPQLVNEELRRQLMQYERSRVIYRWECEPKDKETLAEWIMKFKGPRLLIVNTVRNAAVIADHIRSINGGDARKVEHLSTALTAEDRDIAIERIKNRLKDNSDDDWTLVATSCVEAGVDLSFRTAFREVSSLLSLLQTAGRVNRHGAYKDAEIWSFKLITGGELNSNIGLTDSSHILESYFADGIEIEPSLSTKAMRDEINLNDNVVNTIRELKEAEDELKFKTVAEKFIVIDSDTVTAVVDEDLADRIRMGYGDWLELQKKAVSISKYNAQKLKLEEIKPNIYKWDRKYDDFIGYMAGVIDYEKFRKDFLEF